MLIDTQSTTAVNVNESRIDFCTFRQWAECNLNVHHLLHTFELVPSPVRERKTIIDIL